MSCIYLMHKRLKKLRNILASSGRLPYLISDLNNIRYLTGFTGSYAMLAVTAGDAFFISDSRYEEYARSILPRNIKFVLQTGDVIRELCNILETKELYIEDKALSLSSFLQMKKALRGIKLIPGGSETNNIRMIKDEEEIGILKEAAAITDRCVDRILEIFKAGMTEWELALEIEHFYKTNGCRKTSFDTIVASGAGSSMPHYETALDKKISYGDILLIDMGCEYKGYNSDLTRTFFVGRADSELKRIYGIVKEAQELAVEAVRPEMTAGALDAAARSHIAGAGYGEYFGHGLGHGYGLEVHELPGVRKNDETVLKKNMTITIEPGIYVPQKGGVRIEDMILLTADGGVALTKSSKDLTII